MQFSIEAQGGAYTVRIHCARGQEEKLLEAIQVCRQDMLECEWGLCGRLESMSASIDGWGLCLQLFPRKGAEMSHEAIASCIRHMLPGVEGQP